MDDPDFWRVVIGATSVDEDAVPGDVTRAMTDARAAGLTLLEIIQALRPAGQ